MAKILVVEDKDSMAQMLKQTLELDGFEVVIARDGAEGIKRVRDTKVDVVLTDLKLPKKNGLEVLKASKEENPLNQVIVMTAFGSIETAVNAMKLGAYDFITKPLDTDHLLMLIKRSLENQRLITENMLLRNELSQHLGMPRIIGKSRLMLEVGENIQKVAVTKTTVLLLGESGTGKELFARAIHFLSPRKDHPFVAINCAAIPRELLEPELFGYEKGAFTGAEEKKLGKFELADRGTIFLDEVGEMDMSLQSKLLRSLQEGEIERVGGTGTIKVDIRIIAASNKDLKAGVADRSFREDLYYRLSVFPVIIPPLRERKPDIPALAEHFIAKCAAEMKIGQKKISPGAMDILRSYLWKGNVRELENVLERALILCEGDTITPEYLRLSPLDTGQAAEQDIPMDGTLDDTAKAALRKAESRRIKKALDTTAGNKSRAAELLKVSYKTILTKIKEYNI
ncbi:MAG TPA: sigma-54-dependent Fis family transcriptional regulator [Nitrospirae bacterium]|nr:transcriptional regulatory protein ZraR [bacterium BMS3Abin10]GBE37906.1 transcriptional regulatory protein ZraR [bacterium BMS3Bbin08]HDH50930.1 sigma-54-dependent Fis family transcriptional regulator [Nitrospirota bacterium]HDK80977.1 sigma-54-dependent Fis family transcriptional regulator [Nitrospirota bacterium]